MNLNTFTLPLIAADSIKSLPEASRNFQLYVAVVLVSSIVGLVIVLRSASAASKLVGWLLLPVFPVFLIYSAFPSTTEGSLLGFQVTGAFAAYLILWWFGAKRNLDTENLESENKRLKDDLERQKNQQVVSGTAGTKRPTLLSTSETHCYDLVKNPRKKIALTTGDIMRIDWIDIWVSSENTNMQMARFFEQSVSATLRYFGAKRSKTGDVEEDVIARALAQEMGNILTVQPATVLVTTSGELEQSNKVKRIFHVASVIGQARQGYHPIQGLDDCIDNALRAAENLKDVNCRSILFPLLGTGTGKQDIRESAGKLLDRAISYLEKYPDSRIETVYFLNYTDDQFDVCQALLAANPKVIKSPTKS